MDLIKLTGQNIRDEHICCAISDKKCSEGYQAKKDWIAGRLKDGHVFLKGDVRHKVFIEYCPAEIAWAPVIAPGYNFISCFWVAGQFKGKGHGRELLAECIKDSKSKNGIAAIVGSKKIPYLSDKKFFLMNGFEVCDSAHPYFELVVLRSKKKAPLPEFKEKARINKGPKNKGLTAFYSNGCPFSEYYVNVIYKDLAEKHGIPFLIKKIKTLKQAQSHICPHTIFSLYRDGEFITHEIVGPKKFESLIS